MTRYRCWRSTGNIPDFMYNSARVVVNGQVGSQLTVLRDECVGCAWLNVCHFTSDQMQLLFNTTSATAYKLVHGNKTLYEGKYLFEHRGTYNLTSNGVEELIKPDNASSAYMLIVAFLLLVQLADVAEYIYDRFIVSYYNRLDNVDGRGVSVSSESPSNHRIRSVDVNRGMTIALMIFVNYEGGGIPFFGHSAWDHIKIADWIFPNFLYLCGFSYALGHANKTFQMKTSSRFLKRTGIMFLIGVLIINKNGDWATKRVLGVLQRFALALLALHIIRFVIDCVKFLLTKLCIRQDSATANVDDNQPNPTRYASFESLIVAVLCGLGTALMLLVPAPGCPVGYMGPGGLSEGGAHENCTGGITQYIDRWFLGEPHMYSRPTCQNPYNCSVAYDPEGVLGTIFALINVLAGYQTAIIWRQFPKNSQRLQVLLVFTAAYLGTGFLLSVAGIPINKNLWSPSFSLFTSGLSILFFTALHFIVDVGDWDIFRLYEMTGRNSILIFVLHTLCEQVVPVKLTGDNTYFYATLNCLWGVAIFMLFALYLAHRSIIFTI